MAHLYLAVERREFLLHATTCFFFLPRSRHIWAMPSLKQLVAQNLFAPRLAKWTDDVFTVKCITSIESAINQAKQSSIHSINKLGYLQGIDMG
jgi:hypothetical protein